MLQIEVNKKQREKRLQNGNLYTKRYEKTPKGFLMRTYRNMKSRVLGIQSKKAHLYLGKDLLEKDDFYSWSLKDSAFNALFTDWENSGYDRKITPSIDRIDSSLGYTMDNIRWITHSDNSRLGSIERVKLGMPNRWETL